MKTARQFVSLVGIALMLAIVFCASICAAPVPPCHKHHQPTGVKACDSAVVLADAQPIVLTATIEILPAILLDATPRVAFIQAKPHQAKRRVSVLRI